MELTTLDGNEIECYYEEERTTLSIEMFEHLTGKSIDWIKRKFKVVSSVRSGGHIRLYDRKFIEGELYKYKSGIYKCTNIDTDGTALLNKTGNNLVILSAKNPLIEGWEIA